MGTEPALVEGAVAEGVASARQAILTPFSKFALKSGDLGELLHHAGGPARDTRNTRLLPGNSPCCRQSGAG